MLSPDGLCFRTSSPSLPLLPSAPAQICHPKARMSALRELECSSLACADVEGEEMPEQPIPGRPIGQ